MHCIISGGGLTKEHKIRRSSGKFFIPIYVLRDKFKGKYLSLLHTLYKDKKLSVSSSCERLQNPQEWNHWKENLYKKDWCPYIKETFNGFGNAIEYLGRYTHKIAISNSRILSVTENEVTFSARGKKPGEPKHQITLEHTEFINPPIPDARASTRFPEDPLLWFSEQPDEEKKSETHFYSTGTSAF